MTEIHHESDREYLSFYLDNHDDILLSVSEIHDDHRQGKKPKIQNYVECTVPHYIEDDFKTHFRVNRSTAEYLLEIIATNNGFIENENGMGRPVVSPVKQLLMYLDYMGHESYQYQIETKYGVSVGFVNKVIHHLSKFISLTLSKYFIQWPTCDEAKDNAFFLKERYVSYF